MTKRHKIVIGMVVAMIWSAVIVWVPQTMKAPFMPLNAVIITALLPGGLVLLLIIGRLGMRRFFDDDAIDGAPFEIGTGGDIDQRVLVNSAEQILLAAVLWPFVALTLGGLVALWLGVGFAVARLAFWIGYHKSPPLRAFGYGATFYPTVLATLWALAVWAF